MKNNLKKWATLYRQKTKGNPLSGNLLQTYVKIGGKFFNNLYVNRVSGHSIEMIAKGHTLEVTNLDPSTLEYIGVKKLVELPKIDTKVIVATSQTANLLVNSENGLVSLDYSCGIPQSELSRLSDIINLTKDVYGSNHMGELFIKPFNK